MLSTPPIVYLLYGVHQQLFLCFTDYTANCLFALQITPPIVYLPNGVHCQLFICLTGYTANCVTEYKRLGSPLLKYVSQRMIRLG